MALYSVCDIDSAWPSAEPDRQSRVDFKAPTPERSDHTDEPIQLIEIPPEPKDRRRHAPPRRSRRHAEPRAIGSSGRSLDGNTLFIVVVVVCCILVVQIIMGVLIVYYMSSMQTLLLQYIMNA